MNIIKTSLDITDKIKKLNNSQGLLEKNRKIQKLKNEISDIYNEKKTILENILNLKNFKIPIKVDKSLLEKLIISQKDLTKKITSEKQKTNPNIDQELKNKMRG